MILLCNRLSCSNLESLLCLYTIIWYKYLQLIHMDQSWNASVNSSTARKSSSCHPPRRSRNPASPNRTPSIRHSGARSHRPCRQTSKGHPSRRCWASCSHHSRPRMGRRGAIGPAQPPGLNIPIGLASYSRFQERQWGRLATWWYGQARAKISRLQE